MKEKKVFCSMIEIERKYYPDTFKEREKKVKEVSVEEAGAGVSLARGAIEEVLDDLESLASG